MCVNDRRYGSNTKTNCLDLGYVILKMSDQKTFSLTMISCVRHVMQSVHNGSNLESKYLNARAVEMI